MAAIDLRVVIRADASVSIGSGHVMRTLTLADALTNFGGKVSYVSRSLPGDLCGYIEARGFPVVRLSGDLQRPTINEAATMKGCQAFALDWQADATYTEEAVNQYVGKADWLIVDHYGLPGEWEARLRSCVRRILVIDDLADRAHDCDLFLDQNLPAEPIPECEDYSSSVSRQLKLVGPRYALLRQEFRRLRDALKKRDGTIQRVLIFFGGSDPTNETMKALSAIESLGWADIAIDVVVGASNPNRNDVETYCSSRPMTTFYCQIENLGELMASADLSIGAGGSATWERCCLGLPALLISVAPNQTEIARNCANAGAATYLGTSDEINAEDLAAGLKFLRANPKRLMEMAANALALTDGRGAERVSDAMFELSRDC